MNETRDQGAGMDQDVSALRSEIETYIRGVQEAIAEVERGHGAVGRAQMPDWKGAAKAKFETSRNEVSTSMHRTAGSLQDALVAAMALRHALLKAAAASASGTLTRGGA